MKRPSLLPPMLRTKNHAPLVTSHRNTWTPSLRCVGTCRNIYTGIPYSTIISTCCMTLSQARKSNEDAQHVHNLFSLLPLATLMAAKDSLVHPLLNLGKIFLFSLCTVFVKMLKEFSFSCTRFSLLAQVVQTMKLSAACSSFQLFAGTGGIFLHLSRQHIMQLLVPVSTCLVE
jgi:hypothetical protein